MTSSNTPPSTPNSNSTLPQSDVASQDSEQPTLHHYLDEHLPIVSSQESSEKFLTDPNSNYFEVAEAFIPWFQRARHAGLPAEFLAEFFSNLSVTKEEVIEASWHACYEWDL